MSLQLAWFLLVGVLFAGFFILEGFDFGVGMLMPIVGRGSDTRRRVALNTIGPVWDGNEVWVITAVGAMFAAFPGWYASLFSGFYPVVLAILLAMILRVVAIEWRGKINDPHWRQRCDVGIGIGSWIPAFGWGLVFANILRGVPMSAGGRVEATLLDLLHPYALLGGLTTLGLFALHGAVFLVLKTAGEIRDSAVRVVRVLLVPTAVVVTVFALWTQLSYGKGWTWALFAAVVAGLGAITVATGAHRDGWAFVMTTLTVAAGTALMFGVLYPNVLRSTLGSSFHLTVHNASSTPYTLGVMTWAALIMTPIVLIYQGWTYWVFRKRIATEHISAPVGLEP